MLIAVLNPARRVASQALQPGLLQSAQAVTVNEQLQLFLRNFRSKAKRPDGEESPRRRLTSPSPHASDSTRRRRTQQDRSLRNSKHKGTRCGPPPEELARSVPLPSVPLPHPASPSEHASSRDAFTACNVPSLILSPSLRESTPHLTWKHVCEDSYFRCLFLLRLKVNLPTPAPSVDQSTAGQQHGKDSLVTTGPPWIRPFKISFNPAPSRSLLSRSSRAGARGMHAAAPDPDMDVESQSGSDSDDHLEDAEDEWYLEDDSDELEDSDEEEEDDDDGMEMDGEGGEHDTDGDDDTVGTRFISTQHVVYGYWNKVPCG